MNELNKALHRTAHKAPPVTATVHQGDKMASHSGPELQLLSTVRAFCADRFTASLVIFHPSVYFNDDIFNRLPLSACVSLGTSRKTKTPCEVTPDYAVFQKKDVLGALLRTGGVSGRDLRFDPTSTHFFDLISHSDPIPYMGYEATTPYVPKGKRLIIILKDGAKPLAVLDHKGGLTYNSVSQRRKVLVQARRFAAPIAFMVVEKPKRKEVLHGTEVVAVQAGSFSDADIYELRYASEA